MATPVPTTRMDPNDLSIPTLGGRTRNGRDAREDRGKGIWTEYTKEVKEYDERMTDTWKEDAGGILVFTGLFAATVGAFIIQSYKALSPDETVTLLRQISQQLAGFNNGTYPSPPAPKPFSPSASMIWVNAMWLISLILSITSALFATLLQQWARRYTQMPRIPSESKDRARVRSFLFFGTRFYKTRFAVETVPTLLHISVFLFFAGLIIFFFTIQKTVAIIVSISVGFFALAYFALTILPCIDHKCPYRTPMSNVWWYLWHGSLFLARVCLRWAVKLLHRSLVPDGLGEITSPRQRRLVNWLKTGGYAVGKHKQCLKDGLEKTIVQGAKNAPSDVDRRALTRLFNEFVKADRGKLPKFLASITSEDLTELMTPPIDSGKIVFREPLLTVLRGCSMDARTIGLEEDVRKRSLIVCLDAVHHVVKTLIGPNGVPLLEMTRRGWWMTFGPISRRSVSCRSSGLTQILLSALLLVPFARCLQDRSCTEIGTKPRSWIGYTTSLGNRETQYITFA
ncbi:hypothetical protein BC826DRAFT_340201 [Russula brevipes]|nr:hypothetical protein BC826DRAFT_340201 [Russula brevipes]